MVRRLNPSPWRALVRAGEPWQRRAGATAVLIGVLVVHGCVADQVAERMADFSVDAAMPPRIDVAYVREMELSKPPEAAPVAAPAPAAPKKTGVMRRPEQAASAASAAQDDVVAQATEPPPPEPAAAPDQPASAPAPSASAASAVESPNTTDRFAWPGSTRVSYVLTGNWRGELHGSAQVEWVRVDMRYQVHLDVVIGLPFAPLYTRRTSSEGHLAPEGLVPERYDEEQKLVGTDRRRATIRFEPEGVVLANGQRAGPWPGVQDQTSQFVQLTYLFTRNPQLLAAGNTIEVPLALPRRVDRWVYEVLGPETLYTPFGAVETVHLQPRSRRASRASGELTAEIWFAPSLAYLPARILIRVDAETYLDLMIQRKPQLAQ